MSTLKPGSADGATSYMPFNVSGAVSMTCNLTENPWCGQFGAQQVIEIIILATVSIVGTFGNLLVITSITYLGRQFKNGNTFLINLAFADLLVTGICFPTYVANVFKGDNALPAGFCKFVGYLMTSSAACSLTNLACIAANRYWAIARFTSYSKVFCKRNILLMALCSWIWANLLVAPVVWEGVGLRYDKRVMICVWNVENSKPYNYCLMSFGIFVPAAVISVLYWGLYKSVRVRGQSLRKMSTQSAGSRMEQRSIKKEMAVLKTLLVTVIVFFCFWIPNGVTIVIGRPGPPAIVQKYVAWLCLCNSAVNFIIYGVTNPDYRRGYEKLLARLFCCKTDIFKKRSRTDTNVSSEVFADTKRNRLKLTIMQRQKSSPRVPSASRYGLR